MTTADFVGAKIALLHGTNVLTYLRDDKPTIPFPALWDLPGGGREGDEGPLDCALRELAEEFSIALPRDQVCWAREYPFDRDAGKRSHFFVGALTDADVAAISFGDEGQCWTFMTIDAFVDHPRAVPFLQARLKDYLSER